MSQIKIYGLGCRLAPIRDQLSNVIHSCVMDALGMPKDKRAHRFIALAKEDFMMPGGRNGGLHHHRNIDDRRTHLRDKEKIDSPSI